MKIFVLYHGLRRRFSMTYQILDSKQTNIQMHPHVAFNIFVSAKNYFLLICNCKLHFFLHVIIFIVMFYLWSFCLRGCDSLIFIIFIWYKFLMAIILPLVMLLWKTTISITKEIILSRRIQLWYILYQIIHKHKKLERTMAVFVIFLCKYCT